MTGDTTIDVRADLAADGIHPAVDSILRTGKITTPTGEQIAASSHIPRDECEMLYRMVRATGPACAIEVGMAFGISILCLCDALRRYTAAGAAARLIVMDPAQHDGAWRGLGLRQITDAGFADLVEFHERASQAVLPELTARGVRVQFAFIDGWHTFDHTLVDFFYIDHMLEVGSLIVFDDVGYPSINAALRFVLGNRDYELVEALYEAPLPPGARVKGAIKRLLRPWPVPTRIPPPRTSACSDAWSARTPSPFANAATTAAAGTTFAHTEQSRFVNDLGAVAS
jgi:predicted O-methyltransferase YrrM